MISTYLKTSFPENVLLKSKTSYCLYLDLVITIFNDAHIQKQLRKQNYKQIDNMKCWVEAKFPTQLQVTIYSCFLPFALCYYKFNSLPTLRFFKHECTFDSEPRHLK